MTLLEKLDYLMARDGLNSSLLSKKSGIPYTTIKGMYERGADRIQLTPFIFKALQTGLFHFIVAKNGVELRGQALRNGQVHGQNLTAL